MNDRGTALVVLLLGDPHLLEGGQGGQNGTTDPDGVLSLGGSNDLDLHGRRSKSSNLLLHTIGETGVHRGTTRLRELANLSNRCRVGAYHDNVAVEILSDIDITLHDGVEGGDMDTATLKTQDRRLEESLRSTEALVADGDNLAIGKLVGLLERRALGSGLDLLLKVEGDVAELLLDVTNDFSLSRGREGVTALSKNLHEVVGKIATSHVNTGNGVGKSETLVDGDNVGNTVTGIQDDTGGTTGSVQGEDGLDGDVEGGGVEGLEDNLGHLLTVGLGVDGSLGEQDGVLLRSHTELVVEGVVPDLLHVVPVGNDTVLNGVSQSENTTLGLSLITNVRVLLAHTNHDTDSVSRPCGRGGRDDLPMVTGATDNGSWSKPSAQRSDSRCALEHCLSGVGRSGVEVGYLRKTARGASSPAKPALHIPELPSSQHTNSNPKLPSLPSSIWNFEALFGLVGAVAVRPRSRRGAAGGR